MSQENQDKELGAIARAEHRRRKQALMVLIAVIAAGALVVFLGKTLGSKGVEASIEKSEQEVIQKTNDPQCRALIDEVSAIEREFRAEEVAISADLLSEDEAKAAAVLDKIKALRAKLSAQQEASLKVNLRYDETRQELETWFKYIDNELDTLAQAAAKQKALKAIPEDGVEVKLTKKGKPTAPEKSPQELRDGATLAIYNAFKSFKVWHSATMHPCGAADEGEVGWTPPAAPVTK